MNGDDEPKAETLYVTDAELIRRSGIPEHKARRLIRELDRLPSGFPPKDKLCGDRRYWPAVRAWFDKRTEKLIAQSKLEPARRTGRPT